MTELCIVCEKNPIRAIRNEGRYPSVTCGSECANILSSSDTLEMARMKYRAKHVADDAFSDFVYPKDYVDER